MKYRGSPTTCSFIEENRSVDVVAHRGRLPVWDFELYFEAETIFIPIARFPPIMNRQRQVIESEHYAPTYLMIRLCLVN